MATARIEDTPAVVAMVGRCSQRTLFHRFHGPTDGVAYTRRLFEDLPRHDTLMAWNGLVCVGFATLACDEEGVGHLGVLVEDVWQRRRVGTRLTAALVDGAVARGVSTLRADVLTGDRFILDLLRPIGPSAVSFDLGSFSGLVDLSRAQRGNGARAAALAVHPPQPGGHRSGTALE
ncbi:MAG TPA: GNAT family N-acetyltransferase, partial [Acidimicrobiales bacterium]|nr:GNAT family N-acetyltransferase [Acidimicrobiales bacterium]